MFSGVEKDKKDCPPKKHGVGPNLLPVPISLHFSAFAANFHFLDLDPGGQMNVDSCGSGCTALVTGQYWYINLIR